MTFSLTALQVALPLPSRGIWWVALSGGLDSCVLLHALATLRLPVELRALHINHQISVNADSWQQQCEALCAQLQIPFSAVKVNVKNIGRGLEDAARAARYGVFEQYVNAGDILFTAHHGDDQCETLLLRLMRGTGPRGLAAMARSRALGRGSLYRPLLDFTRAELEDYASQHRLRWVTDESNSDDHYDRNYLRNQVMPLLRRRWPAFAGKWQQAAELCATSEALIEELAVQDLQLADFQSALIGTSINLGHLQALSLARRHNLLRTWLRGQGLAVPEQQHLQQIEQQIIAGRQDAESQVSWADVSLRVYRRRVFALPLEELPGPDRAAAGPLNVGVDVRLGVTLRFNIAMSEASGDSLLRPDLPNLRVDFRRGGERCRPAGRTHSQTLKRLLQDYGVEPWLRESLPLVYSGETLVAVANLWICEGYTAAAGGYRLKYERKTH